MQHCNLTHLVDGSDTQACGIGASINSHSRSYTMDRIVLYSEQIWWRQKAQSYSPTHRWQSHVSVTQDSAKVVRYLSRLYRTINQNCISSQILNSSLSKLLKGYEDSIYYQSLHAIVMLVTMFSSMRATNLCLVAFMDIRNYLFLLLAW